METSKRDLERVDCSSTLYITGGDGDPKMRERASKDYSQAMPTNSCSIGSLFIDGIFFGVCVWCRRFWVGGGDGLLPWEKIDWLEVVEGREEGRSSSSLEPR